MFCGFQAHRLVLGFRWGSFVTRPGWVMCYAGENRIIPAVAAVEAEMVVNVHDAAVDKLVSHDVVLFPKLVPVRPPAVDQTPSSLPSPSTVVASDMHQYSDKVIF